MDILLHICCGPCLIHPFSRFKNQGFKIKGFYYNPNIYPADEYNNRKGSLEFLNKDLQLDIEFPEYGQSEFFQTIAGREDLPQRCRICWEMRLRKTARQAKESGFGFFSTTLLVSPYQDHKLLKQLGEKIAKDTGVDFYYEDFRPGFKSAYQEAKQRGLYLQKYCGCKYSIKRKACAANEK